MFPLPNDPYASDKEIGNDYYVGLALNIGLPHDEAVTLEVDQSGGKIDGEEAMIWYKVIFIPRFTRCCKILSLWLVFFMDRTKNKIIDEHAVIKQGLNPFAWNPFVHKFSYSLT